LRWLRLVHCHSCLVLLALLLLLLQVQQEPMKHLQRLHQQELHAHRSAAADPPSSLPSFLQALDC
jgi:hypothetical protein